MSQASPHRHLVLAPFVGSSQSPYAGHQFFHHYLQALSARGWSVTLVCPATETVEPDERGYTVVPVVMPAPSRHVTAWRRLTASMQDRAPHPGVAHGPVSELLAAADSLELHWDTWLPALPALRRRRPELAVAGVAQDLVFESRARALAAGVAGNALRVARPFLGMRRRQELRLLASCDVAVVFKEEDGQRIRSQGGGAEVLVAPPWLATSGTSAPQSEQGVVLFVGAFDRRENDVSARWLLDEVWPRVSVRLPGARLVLAGGGVPAWLRQRESDSVMVTGFLPDLEPVYRRAQLVVAPVRAGAGLKFKVPQAMAYGLPVVATALAMEGLRPPPGAVYAVADDAGEFADAVIAGLLDPVGARRAGELGQAWVAGEFDFGVFVEQVVAALSRGRRAPSR